MAEKKENKITKFSCGFLLLIGAIICIVLSNTTPSLLLSNLFLMLALILVICLAIILVQFIKSKQIRKNLLNKPGKLITSNDTHYKLERLYELHKSGVLTDAEFESKKVELQNRLSS